LSGVCCGADTAAPKAGLTPRHYIDSSELWELWV
jgi:hypothetical protein